MRMGLENVLQEREPWRVREKRERVTEGVSD